MIKNNNRAGFIDRQREEVGVGEENSSLFFLLALRARRCFRKERKENKTTSVYRLVFSYWIMATILATLKKKLSHSQWPKWDYRVSQKFVPLLYKSVTQYDWTWSAHNLNQSCDFQSNLIFILLVPSFDSKFDLCNFAPKVRCASKFSRHIFFAFCSPKCSSS